MLSGSYKVYEIHAVVYETSTRMKNSIVFTQKYFLAGRKAEWDLSFFFVELGVISVSRMYKFVTVKPGVHNHIVYFLKIK